MFPSIISQDLYSDMQRIDDCPLECNLAEITQIRDLPGQFGACAQQCESGLLLYTNLKMCSMLNCKKLSFTILGPTVQSVVSLTTH